MRAGIAAAALATLVLAAPAAAQPNATQVLRGAVQAINRSHGPQVQDYTFTMVHGATRTPVYVERGDEEWMVHASEESPMGSLMSMAVVWPTFADVEDDGEEITEAMEAARYVRSERVEGRATHVITADMGEDAVEEVDTALVYIDAETSHLLRMYVVGEMPAEGGQFAGGDMRLTVDMLDHQETDGVVVPRRVRVRMLMEMPEMSADDLAQMSMSITAVRAQLEGSTDPEEQGLLAVVEMFAKMLDGGELDLPMTIEDVVVNAGPPAWLDEEM
ncbi:MAG TPA: hypothetical protein VLK84_18325 [Longimicrobium sp.]|nr:hypothetical protein [Longimicrobium sp.]